MENKLIYSPPSQKKRWNIPVASTVSVFFKQVNWVGQAHTLSKKFLECWGSILGKPYSPEIQVCKCTVSLYEYLLYIKSVGFKNVG